MEVDTGASVSIMSEATFEQLWPGRSLSPTEVRLCTYLREPIHVLGCATVKVHYEGQLAQLQLIVVKGEGPTLLGRSWLEKITLNWSRLNYTPKAGLPEVLERYKVIFDEKLGTLQGFEAHICVDSTATPRFCRA